MKDDDVEIYVPTEFVHMFIDDNSSRTPEEVEIFKNGDESQSISYKVTRGKSIIYDWFRAWRMLSLMEDSIILNRLTKSSIIRIFQIDVGDMSKNMIRAHIQGIKDMVEQKAAINAGNYMSDYANPGPIENSIYIPVHEGKGTINVGSIGGDFDPKSLVDLEYFLTNFYSGTGIPKQFTGWCLRGDTLIPLLNGSKVTIKEMFENKDMYIGKGIMGCNSDGSLCPTTIKDIQLTKPSTDFIRLYFDNGKYVDVTDEHRMMLRDGSFVCAKDLIEGDSLMPYYEKYKDSRKYVLDNKLGKYLPQYRVVANAKFDSIPKGNQIHHIDSIKANDDFDNLANLTLEEHCLVHHDMLHKRNKDAYKKKRANGTHSTHKGNKIITNGIENRWLRPGEELPEGFYYGNCWFTPERRKEYSERFIAMREALPDEKKCCGGYKKDEATEETKLHCSQAQRKRYDSMTEEEKQQWHDAQSARIKRDHQKMVDSRMAKLRETNPDVVKSYRYTRCPVCGEISTRKINYLDYVKYLNNEKFYYCSQDHLKMINGGGKLGRSFKLLKDSTYDFDVYETTRFNGSSRPDTYFSATRLKEIVDTYLVDYVPECNHKIIKIERLDVSEPSYDLNVTDDCHTFALDCGIFVHNCEDAAGFSGGESLALLSSQFGKRVKRYQMAFISGITTFVNILALDNNLDDYVNNFTLRMTQPVTREDLERKDSQTSALAILRDTMDVLSDVEDKAIRLKIVKTLLQDITSNNEVTEYVQEQIDKFEEQEKTEPTTDAETNERGPVDIQPIERPSSSFGNEEERPSLENPLEQSEVEQETTAVGETETSSEDNYLPSFEEMGINGA